MRAHCVYWRFHLLPAHARSHHTQRFIPDLVLLVHHEQIRRTRTRQQCLLAVINRPLEFLGRNQNLSEAGINFGLPRVEAGDRGNVVLVNENPSLEYMSVSPLHTRCKNGTYFSIVFSTFRRSANVVLAQATCAFFARTTARSIPSGVVGLTAPSN